MKKKDEIAAELKALNADFGGEGANDPAFHTPENYFREFPDQMTAIIQAMNADTSFTLPVAQNNPFSVPDGYFDQLSATILGKVRTADHIVTGVLNVLPDTGKKSPYHLPEDYFAGFEQQLFHKIFKEEQPATEELTGLSPLLADLKKEQPFAVPKGYFNSETFSRKVQEEEQQVTAKVIEHPSVRSIKWARWAAAAAVIGIFALGGLHYLGPQSASSKPSFEQSLAQIPDRNIKEWLSNNMDESDINNLGGSIANVTITNVPTLNNFSEQEIRDYLEAEF